MKELKRFCSFLIVAILFTSCTKTTDFYTIQGEAQGSTYSIKYISTEEKVTKKTTTRPEPQSQTTKAVVKVLTSATFIRGAMGVLMKMFKK